MDLLLQKVSHYVQFIIQENQSFDQIAANRVCQSYGVSWNVFRYTRNNRTSYNLLIDIMHTCISVVIFISYMCNKQFFGVCESILGH